MKTNKLIININNLTEIEEYKKIGITNFLFAIEDFSIGYATFSLEELRKIDANIYLLINRMMDNEAILALKKLDLSFTKGIFFEDVGVFQTLKDKNIPLIYNQMQFATNKLSINIWLKDCLSAVISNSLTKEEIIEIVNSAKKPLILNVFGKNMAMYSRRTLLTNFNKYMDLDKTNISETYLEELGTKTEFLARENKYGTVLFKNIYFDYTTILKDINDDNILMYYINNVDLSVEDIKKVLKGKFDKSDKGFLEKKTIFKVGDKNA